MNKPKVLIPSPDCPKVAMDMLSEKCELIINQEKDSPTKEQILTTINGVDAILWTSKVPLDKELIETAGPDLKVVSTVSAGIDHIDVKELIRRKIKLGNTPKVADSSVADVAVMLILATMRRLQEGRDHILKGTWVYGLQWNLGQDIRGATVGIVGYGGIAENLIKRLKAFKVARFLYTRPTTQQTEAESQQIDPAVRKTSLEELLHESDVIVSTCALTDETRGMFNDEAFLKMKPTAVFINVSRAAVVDQDALIRALEKRSIFAAGLDVMTPEPLPKNHALLNLPNCVISPHMGSATVKTRNDIALLAARNILAGLAGETLPASAYVDNNE